MSVDAQDNMSLEELKQRAEMVKNMTPEERAKKVEEAEKAARAAWEKLSPEERRKAEIEGQKLMEEKMASMQAILDKVNKVREESSSKQVPKPKFCSECGAPVSGGKFCTNCGKQLW